MTGLHDPSADGSKTLNTVFRALADRDRRRLLQFVRQRNSDPLTNEDLASCLVTDRETTREGEGQGFQEVLTTLRHKHVPKLEEAGLIEREGKNVSATDHPAFQDTGIVSLLGEETGDSEAIDSLFRALANGRRRRILDVLSHQFGSIHVETLARELGATEMDADESAVRKEVIDELLASLHHADLPQLAATGLIDYDADDQTVEYTGHPALRVPWMHSVLGPDFRDAVTVESDAEEPRTIEGRENVVSYGQSLCGRAEEELFCLFTQTDLLEAGCFTRLRDASRERDVDVYLGTRDPTVQEYVRENAPAVTLWEPEANWLNLPVANDTVGRLLVADREAAMVGTLHDTDSNGTRDEQAMIGEGTDDPLVVMVTQLLRPYLEQRDEDLESIEFQLPS